LSTGGERRLREDLGRKVREIEVEWGASGSFPFDKLRVRMTARTGNNNARCKGAAVEGIGVGGEADFSAAAANTPPSVEMTEFRWRK
jgi:hypothetical protein